MQEKQNLSPEEARLEAAWKAGRLEVAPGGIVGVLQKTLSEFLMAHAGPDESVAALIEVLAEIAAMGASDGPLDPSDPEGETVFENMVRQFCVDITERALDYRSFYAARGAVEQP